MIYSMPIFPPFFSSICIFSYFSGTPSLLHDSLLIYWVFSWVSVFRCAIWVSSKGDVADVILLDYWAFWSLDYLNGELEVWECIYGRILAIWRSLRAEEGQNEEKKERNW